MKNTLAVIAVAIALCCAVLVGPASQARAVEDCTTQGALALALADVLGISVTSAQAAADALALRGIAPLLGWDVEACLTPEVAQEIRDSFDDAASFERALAMIKYSNRVYPRDSSSVPPIPPPPPDVSRIQP